MIEKDLNWARWHPLTLVKETEGEQEVFYEDYPGPYKKMRQDCRKGDIIEDYHRSVRIKLVEYRCPFCTRRFRDWFEATEHAGRYKNGTALNTEYYHPKMNVADLETVELEKYYPAALFYYLVVRPEAVLEKPKSIEWSPNNPVKTPTVAAREAHDQAMLAWREKMKETRGQRPFHLELSPTVDCAEAGVDGKWWYWCPQIYKNNVWLTIGLKTQTVPDDTKEKVRVLYLLAIIPRDLEVFSEDFEL